jgi:hypothetical protein
MAGSHVAVIVMPIVIAVALAFWISLVYYASFHPRWKHQHRAPRTEVAGGAFEATHSGRQLEPLWGEPVEAIPQQREGAAADTYHAAHAETGDQERAASSVGAPTGAQPPAGARATGSRPPTESGPTGAGWPPELSAPADRLVSSLLVRQQLPLRLDCAVSCG